MRPAVVHGYGGAKVDLPVSLPELSGLGWTTLGASLVTGWYLQLFAPMVQKRQW